jgi:GNAT superfamily N-acetyltransferase
VYSFLLGNVNTKDYDWGYVVISAFIVINKCIFWYNERQSSKNFSQGIQMDIEIKEVTKRKDLKEFIFLPEKIHQSHPTWVPPIYVDEWKYFDPKHNRSFAYCDVIRLLAKKDGQTVGRIMGIINKKFNEIRNVEIARFGYLETWEDEEVVRALLERVEDWARKHGMTKIIGPYGFTDQDPEGFMIEGFENRATIATYCNFDWMPRMIEALGYEKDIDYFVYKLEVPKEFPEFYKKIYERVKKKGNFQVLEFRTKRQLKPWIKPVLRLMNECYTESNIYGYAPLDEKEMEELTKRYISVIDPRFVKGVKREGEVVAFIVGIPDMTEGIQKARGRLFPLGFIKILRAAKKTKQLDLLLGAIRDKYRGRGLDVLMGVSMIMSAREAGMEMMDTHHEMEENVKVRGEMERMGGRVYKKYRVYQKSL